MTASRRKPILSDNGYANTVPSSAVRGRARMRAFSSSASLAAVARQRVSQDGQIIALPWLLTQSAHQPLPHSEQIPCDGVDAWFAQRRQILPPARAGRGPAVCDARAAPARGSGRWGRRCRFVGRLRDRGRRRRTDDWCYGWRRCGGGRAGARASDASATTKTVLQPLHRAFRPGTPSLSGGTRRALRHLGHRTVTWRSPSGLSADYRTRGRVLACPQCGACSFS